jgi:ATP/maltotriose-dependent transcriptional regulator MalT/DNA-binding SARP family transcriptional activator
MRRVVIPKVVPPRLARVIRRGRVSALMLNGANRGAALWIHAAGGSGKTTAVASVAADLKIPTIWVHLDAGDAEAPSFFHYLRLSMLVALPKAATTLPAFGAELATEVALYTRRFARAALDAFPPTGATLVLDNLQDIPVESGVHAVIAILAEELVPAWKVFLVSREAPHPSHLRLLGQGKLETVAPAELAFTEGELKAALRERGVLAEERLDALWRETGGWIAGALLLSMQPEGKPSSEAGSRDHEAVFDYFASQALASLDPADRRLLLRTAYLSTISADGAARLAELPDAGKRLERLAAGGTFTMRLEGSPARYRYHDLFRDYLRVAASQSLSAAELDALKRSSASALIETGDPLPALELLAECQDWDGFGRAAVAQAENLLNQGHFRSFAALILRVPAAIRDADPWLLYWLGQCQLRTSDDRALESLSKAHARFVERADRTGQLVAAIDIPALLINEMRVASEYGRWLERIEALVGEASNTPSEYLALKVAGGLLGIAPFSQRLRDHSDEIVRRVLDLVPRVSDPNLRLQALTHVAFFTWRLRRTDLAPSVIEMVAAQRLEELASPLVVLRWYYELITYDSMYGDSDRALAYSLRGEAIAAATGLPNALFEALLLALEVACDRNDVAGARALVSRLERHADPSRLINRASVHAFRARIALLEDDGRLALDELARGVAALDASGWPSGRRTAYYMIEAGALSLLGRFAEALESGARHRPHFEADYQEVIDIFSAWIRAAAAQGGDPAEARRALAEAVAFAAKCRYELPLRHANRLVSALCARALAERIDPAFIRGMIERRHLQPPDSDTADWPWPLRISCLGGFEILGRGERISAQGRNQKTIELLQFVIALGGSKVAVERIVKALWPGEGREGAQQVFDTTVHRLRKLLGSDRAIIVGDRQVTLDRREVWVDALALGRWISRLEAGAAPPHREDLAQLVSVYRGHFLPHVDASWKREMHERLWGGMRRILIAGAARAQAAGDLEDAERILYFIVDRDPLAEDAFAAIVRMHLDRGQPTEALRAYRRCAAALDDELGTAPGRELQTLMASLGKV